MTHYFKKSSSSSSFLHLSSRFTSVSFVLLPVLLPPRYLLLISSFTHPWPHDSCVICMLLHVALGELPTTLLSVFSPSNTSVVECEIAHIIVIAAHLTLLHPGLCRLSHQMRRETVKSGREEDVYETWKYQQGGREHGEAFKIGIKGLMREIWRMITWN